MKYAVEENNNKPSFSFIPDGESIPTGFKEITIQEYRTIITSKSNDIHGTYDGTNWIAEAEADKTTRESQEATDKAAVDAVFDAKVLAAYDRLVASGDIV